VIGKGISVHENSSLKGSRLSESGPGLRRVSVHAGAAVVDLTLPAGVPVATLIPSIVDILTGRGTDSPGGLVGRRYQLSLPGTFALDASTTLAQNGIRDGEVIVLSEARTPLPAPRYDDVAEAVSTTLDTTAFRSNQPRDRKATRLMGAVAASCLTGIGAVALTRNALSANATHHLGATAGVAALAGFVALLFAVIAHRAHRDPVAGLTLSVIATAFAAVAGILAVPAAPGIPSVLLAAMAAAVMSVLAMRLSGCGVVTLTAVSCFALVVAIAALVGVITAAPLHVIGSVSALLSLGLLGVAARVSIVLAGLSPQLPPAPDLDTADCLAAKAIRADNWLTSLLAAFASSAAVGAIVAMLTGAPRLSCIAFASVTGALLLSDARCNDRRRALIFVVSGIVTTGTTFGVTAAGAPDHGPWIAAVAAMLAAAAIYLGFVAPTMSLSPVVRRSVELLECLALVAMVPLTCWICGLYGTVRGFNPTWS
jgi:type VII secretion integral membrane protein EccD